MAFCRKDIKKAILDSILNDPSNISALAKMSHEIIDQALEKDVDNRHTFDRVSTTLIKIHSIEDDTLTRAQHNQQSWEIGNRITHSLAKLYDKNIGGRVFQKDASSPVYVEVYVSYKFVESEFMKLKEEDRNNVPVDFSRDIAYFNGEIQTFANEHPEYNDYEYYEQKVNTINRSFDSSLNIKLINILTTLYPNINIEHTNDHSIRGKAIIDAKLVLINSLLQGTDTLPHEYAHHYIAMFRDSSIVKEGIKKWGTEENLVQAIGEQVVTQKGEAYNWWNKFVSWILNKLKNISSLDKEEIKNILTDAFLMNADLSKYNVSEEDVQYTLKAINILPSDKAKQIFDKGNKNGWSLDKILQELAIPKEQKQLLLNLGITDREQLAVELASKYSYTVEVNTAKEGTDFYGAEDFRIQDTRYYTITGEKFYKIENDFANNFNKESIEIDFKEFEKAAKQYKDVNETPTQHYSNLTVPGGTNGSYIEANIETPMIVPSIQSHAQFKTDNTIGWMRADEKQNYQEKDIDNLIEIMKKSGILEVNCG